MSNKCTTSLLKNFTLDETFVIFEDLDVILLT